MPLVAAEVSTFLCGRFGNLTSSGLVSGVPNLNGKINGRIKYSSILNGKVKGNFKF